METIHTIEWMKETAREARRAGHIVGLIPTMGALHDGHLSLVHAAKQQCSPIVVSIFVNPSQFAPGEDFEKYPRRIEQDRAALESLDVDYVFAPSAAEMYPAGFCTSVHVEGLSERVEGKSRPGHFCGVATVVLKLFEIVRPDFAFFGRKDAQQARILQQMASDLNLNVQIVVCPIVREPDGLALSSRNAYLNAEERHAAPAIHRALLAASGSIACGERDVQRLLTAMRGILQREPLLKLDYAEIVDAHTLEPAMILRGECLILLAVYAGKTRLIDNALAVQAGGGFDVMV